MSQPAQPSTSTIRKIANDRLSAIYMKENSLSIPPAAQESYLFENNHYVGVRFVANDLTFEWRLGDENASIHRGKEQIETVAVSAFSTVRKAA